VLLDELDEKLRLKFLWSKAKADEVREQLEALCDLVSTTNGPNVIVDDPDDDRVLECAIAGGADCIVSGDRHLLKLGVYVAILTVRQFIGRINPAV
jgi:predicted nucleic acid-binding protein